MRIKFFQNISLPAMQLTSKVYWQFNRSETLSLKLFRQLPTCESVVWRIMFFLVTSRELTLLPTKSFDSGVINSLAPKYEMMTLAFIRIWLNQDMFEWRGLNIPIIYRAIRSRSHYRKVGNDSNSASQITLL